MLHSTKLPGLIRGALHEGKERYFCRPTEQLVPARSAEGVCRVGGPQAPWVEAQSNHPRPVRPRNDVGRGQGQSQQDPIQIDPRCPPTLREGPALPRPREGIDGERGQRITVRFRSDSLCRYRAERPAEQVGPCLLDPQAQVNPWAF